MARDRLTHFYEGPALKLNVLGLPGDFPSERIRGPVRILRRGQGFGAGQVIVGNGEDPEECWLIARENAEALVPQALQDQYEIRRHGLSG